VVIRVFWKNADGFRFTGFVGTVLAAAWRKKRVDGMCEAWGIDAPPAASDPPMAES